MNRINLPGGLPVDPRIGRMDPGPPSAAGSRTGETSFREIFQKELDQAQGLRFSAHAKDRLTARDIRLSPETMNRLVDAVDQAAAKGARDALLFMPGASRAEDLALVVSVTNRTVITAMDGERMQNNVFTNIDSAVVVH